MNATERKALRWLFGPNTGASSETMCRYFLLGDKGQSWGPGDPSDFHRCMGLFAAVPEWRKRVPELASLGGQWPALAKNWDKLEALYLKEAPTGQCPKMYALMTRLRFPKRRSRPSPPSREEVEKKR